MEEEEGEEVEEEEEEEEEGWRGRGRGGRGGRGRGRGGRGGEEDPAQDHGVWPWWRPRQPLWIANYPIYYTSVIDPEYIENCGGDDCNVYLNEKETEWIDETYNCSRRCKKGQMCRLTPADMQEEGKMYMDCKAGLYCHPGKLNNGLGICKTNKNS